MKFSETQVRENLFTAIQAALKAGEEILKIYTTDFDVELKEDTSPLTQADKNAHEAIKAMLAHTGIPLLSEEGKEIDYAERKSWSQLWIVDPLDGTKEFVKKNGEFAVNIALVEEGYPVAGVIYVPVSRELFYVAKNLGVYKKTMDEHKIFTEESFFNQRDKLEPSFPVSDTYRIVASRSHMSEETEAFIADKKAQYKSVELLSKGSSLKFCLIAEGRADCYPRYTPTMEWDTAAGQILVEEAGKTLIDQTTGQRMRYGRENLRNSCFVVE